MYLPHLGPVDEFDCAFCTEGYNLGLEVLCKVLLSGEEVSLGLTIRTLAVATASARSPNQQHLSEVFCHNPLLPPLRASTR